jgi:hypothetical protein
MHQGPVDNVLQQQRLHKALKYLELARTSRAMKYQAIPFVLAAEELIKLAIQEENPIA